MFSETLYWSVNDFRGRSGNQELSRYLVAENFDFVRTFSTSFLVQDLRFRCTYPDVGQFVG